jgi:hypothetical protein
MLAQRTPPFVVYVSTTRAYEFSGKSALRSIELMSPVKGSSSSKTRSRRQLDLAVGASVPVLERGQAGAVRHFFHLRPAGVTPACLRKRASILLANSPGKSPDERMNRRRGIQLS